MQLVEIKKNNTGTGLLIENDGYISMDKGENKKIPCHSYYIKDFINKFSNNAITKDKTVKFQTFFSMVIIYPKEKYYQT